MAARQTRGRQRIPMRLIQNQDDLYASFSKRRLGLFKKASELSTLCGADVGIIVFSPTDNPFSFFSPTMDSVVDRYTNPDRPLSQAARAVDAHARARIDALNKRLDEAAEQKRALKEYEERLEEARERGWWEEAAAVDGLSKEQVREWVAWFRNFKGGVENKMAELRNGGGSSSSAFGAAGPSASIQSYVEPSCYAGQYFGVAMQDQGGGGGGGGVGQYLFPPPPPVDPFYRHATCNGGGGSGHIFSSQYRHYMSAEGDDPFAAGGSGGGGGGSGYGSGQYVFPAPAYVDQSGPTGNIPSTSLCFPCVNTNPSASAGEEEEEATSNQVGD